MNMALLRLPMWRGVSSASLLTIQNTTFTIPRDLAALQLCGHTYLRNKANVICFYAVRERVCGEVVDCVGLPTMA